MPPKRWERREEKLRKKKAGMRVSGRSIFVLQDILKKKAEEARKSIRKRSKKKTK